MDTIKSDSPGLIGLYRAFWRYAEGARLKVVTSSALLVSSQLVKLAIPWLTAQAINAVQTSGSAATAALLILAIIGAVIVSWAMHGPGRVIERTVAVHIRQQLSGRLYQRVSTLPLAWHEKHHSGETLHRIQQTTHALSDFAGSQFIYLQNFVNIVGPIVALTVLSGLAGSVAVAGFLLIGFVVVRFDRILMKLVRAQNDAERGYSGALVDALGNISTVISLRLQKATARMLDSKLAAVFEPLRRNIVINEAKWCAMDVLTMSLTWGVVAVFAWSRHQTTGTLLIGNVFMVYQYASQAGGVIAQLAMHYQNFARMRVDFAMADPILNATETQAPQGGVSRDWRELAIEGLDFSYARGRRETPLLHGANIAFERGEAIALVGPSGSGKSTLMRVLAGLYDADRGRFTIDGMPHVGLKNLGAIATLIPQEAEVFEGTVRENITFGVPYADEAIAAAIRISCFDAVLETLPQGLDTLITERGLNLSGGQKQRLALARGILAAQSSSLLLLDEPTSSLDPATEARVFAAFRDAVPDATVIASVHRLNLLPRFDRVVLMAEGRVVDTGSVDELLHRQPLFRELWNRSHEAAGEAVAA